MVTRPWSRVTSSHRAGGQAGLAGHRAGHGSSSGEQCRHYASSRRGTAARRGPETPGPSPRSWSWSASGGATGGLARQHDRRSGGEVRR